MTLSMTISKYLARSYALNTIYLFFGLLSVIYLFDMVELIRRASKIDGLSLGVVFQMGLLKLPEVGQILFPFAILFAAMFTFWQFNHRSELVVLRSSGFSVWQFIAPVVFVAVLIGIIQVGAINPLGAVLVSKYERLESQYLERQKNQIAIFREGLWLRQNLQVPNSAEESGYAIVNAKSVKQPEWVLQDISVFYFDAQDRFTQRLDSAKARLEPGRWVFEDPIVHRSSGVGVIPEDKSLVTRLTIEDIEESFSSPQSLSFWHLPQHIKTLEQTGFNSSRLQVHYQNLLAQPLLLAAMVLLAAAVSMRPLRTGGAAALLVAGIMVGFLVFFMSSYLQALGASQQIPPVLAGWSPALICMLLGLAVIMTLEDG